MKRIIFASLALLWSQPAFSQAFSLPATIASPTTANHCLKVQSTGGNAIVDTGAACGSGDASLSGNNVWTGTVRYTTLPTSDPHVAGQLWNNAGVLQVSAG